MKVVGDSSRCSPATRPRRRLPVAAEVLEVAARGRAPLALVLRPDTLRAVRQGGGGGHAQEGDLADLHPRIERDRQVGNVGQLEGEMAIPARVDESRGGMNEQAQAAEGTLPFQSGDEVVWQRDALGGGPEDELAGMKD